MRPILPCTAKERAFRNVLLRLLEQRPQTMPELQQTLKLRPMDLLPHLQALRDQGLLCHPQTNRGPVWAVRELPPKPRAIVDGYTAVQPKRQPPRQSWWVSAASPEVDRSKFYQALEQRNRVAEWLPTPARFSQGRRLELDATGDGLNGEIEAPGAS